MNEPTQIRTYTHVQIRLFMTPIIRLLYMYGTQSVRQNVLCIAIRPLSPDKRKLKFAQMQFVLHIFTHMKW